MKFENDIVSNFNCSSYSRLLVIPDYPENYFFIAPAKPDAVA